MTLFLAWSPGFEGSGFDGSGLADSSVDDLVGEATGPWREVRRAGPQLLLVDSDATLSQVYHALKWAVPRSPSLMVTACDGVPKAKGLPAGTVGWLRSRTASSGQ